MIFCVIIKSGLSECRNPERASFYADKFNGRKMANGSIFKNNEYLIASRQFPLGTVVSITNCKTGKSIVLKVSDYGPQGKYFSLDMSKAAFRAVGFNESQGWGWVEVRKVKDE